MAAGKEFKQIDVKALQELKRSLFCSICEAFPRQGSNVYLCKVCNNLVCEKCWNEVEPNLEMKFFCKNCYEKCPQNRDISLTFKYSAAGIRMGWDGQECNRESFVYCNSSVNDHTYHNVADMPEVDINPGLADPIATKLVALFKFHPCDHLKKGCQDEFDTKDLEEHQKSCIFRKVTCPDLKCSEEFTFNTILDHYMQTSAFLHSGLETKNDNLDFKGTAYQLNEKTFILNSYGKPFFPQFYIKGNMLHFWIIGHCDEVEASMFEASISFFYNGKWNRALMDNVKPIDMDKQSLKNGEFGLIFSLKTLTQYFDHQAKVRKNHDMIEFELKIVCEKLDEIAKDENVESGVEDSDDN